MTMLDVAGATVVDALDLGEELGDDVRELLETEEEGTSHRG